jgi:hypothetical protein
MLEKFDLARIKASALKQMRTAFFWVITKQAMVIIYRRFGKTYRSQIQGSRIQKERREP